MTGRPGKPPIPRLGTHTETADLDWLCVSYILLNCCLLYTSIRGAASFCLNWALEQCRNLRIDTHRDNVVMQHMLDKNGFQYCGIIYLEDGSERLGYQKRM